MSTKTFKFVDCIMAVDCNNDFRMISFGMNGDPEIDEQDILNDWLGGDLVFYIPKEIEHEAECGLWKCDMLFTWIPGSFDSDADSSIKFEGFKKLLKR